VIKGLRGRVRIGVFVCHCGSNIGGVIDINRIVEYAWTLPLVKHVEDNVYSCSEAGLSSIKKHIGEHDLNRVVVAACTPRTHEKIFRQACEEAGLNRYLFEFVNIREHCSWIHMNEPDKATVKAMELIRLGVMKAAYLEALEAVSTQVKPASLVIGGGVAGMSAAENLAGQGFDVHVVERNRQLGGLAAGLWKLMPGDQSARDFLASLINRVEQSQNIRIYLNSQMTSISGFIGEFDVCVASPEKKHDFTVGTVILATGAQELKPLGLYRHGVLKGVMTQQELEKALKRGRKRFGDVVFINCAGARTPGREYCGRLCCATSIKNARYIRDMSPASRVTVLQRDVMAFGTEFEREYRNAQDAGVRFIRYDPDRPPEVLGDEKVTHVRVFHTLYGEDVILPASMVVLTTPLIPQDGAEDLGKMLKVPLDDYGFFLEAHLKLKPVEFATEGVYIAGSARFPVGIGEAVAQGIAAAAKAAAPMAAGKISIEATTAQIDVRLCSGCRNCEIVCPFAAVEIKKDDRGRNVSSVNAVLCKGCGACVAACPNGAIQQQGFTDLQITSMIETMACVPDES
jgi:heterodisulfide reductase subunit A